MQLRIGTRPSPLALAQVQEAVTFIRQRGIDFDFSVVPIASDGDLDKVTPFFEMEGTDFFTRQIENALLNGEIDVAVHSAKDLEDTLPEGLAIALMTPTISEKECLVSRNNAWFLETLPWGSSVGTSSRKRQEALLRYRSDLIVKGIRGTICERLQQLDQGKFDAVIVAHAALLRLGLESRISQIIPPEIMAPHPLQGRLALQVRANDRDVQALFQMIPKTTDSVTLTMSEAEPCGQ